MILQNKKALIMGVANERSIAYGIAKSFKAAGAEIGLTYIDLVEKRAKPLADDLGASLFERCDVAYDEQIEALGRTVASRWGHCDILVHSLAYADREDLEKAFVETSRKGFHTALDISAYSLIGVTRALLPCLQKVKGSVLCLSYYGAEKVVTNYNVMGVAKAALEASTRYLAADVGPKNVRVNAISAGPIRTLAASGVKDFRSILNQIEQKAPLRKNVTTEEVGQVATFLCSEMASAITGEVIYVDSGYNIMGL